MLVVSVHTDKKIIVHTHQTYICNFCISDFLVLVSMQSSWKRLSLSWKMCENKFGLVFSWDESFFLGFHSEQ